VGLARREPGDHGRDASQPEEPLADDRGKNPDDRDSREVGDPVAPGLHGGDLRPHEGGEDQAGKGEVEDEFRDAVSDPFRYEAGQAGEIAEADQPKDRKDDSNEFSHGLSAGRRAERSWSWRPPVP